MDNDVRPRLMLRQKEVAQGHTPDQSAQKPLAPLEMRFLHSLPAIDA